MKAAGVGNAARSLSLKSILSAVGWRRESTSRTFYQMPVVDQGEFGATVLVHWPLCVMVAVVILSLVDIVWFSYLGAPLMALFNIHNLSRPWMTS